MSTSQQASPGAWGSGLSADRFARALAAAGVLAALDAGRHSATKAPAARTAESALDLLRQRLASLVQVESPLLQWTMPVDSHGQPPPWMPPPQALELAWAQALAARKNWFLQRYRDDGGRRIHEDFPKTGLRLELPDDFDLLRDATSSLVNADTGIDSLAALVKRKPRTLEWNWPLRLRVLATTGIDPVALEAFRTRVPTDKPWLADHLTLLDDSQAERADFAMLFCEGHAAAHAYLQSSEASVNADCLLVAMPVPKDSDAPIPAQALNQMLGRLKVSGIVSLTGVRPGDKAAVSWLTEFMRELSHAVTVDAAAARAAKESRLQPPTMRLSRSLLEHTHVRRRQATIQSQLERALPGSRVFAIYPDAQYALGLGGTATAQALARALPRRVTHFDFSRESQGASVIAALSFALAQSRLEPQAAVPAAAPPPATRSRSTRRAYDVPPPPPPPRPARRRFAEDPRSLQAQLFSVQDEVLAKFRHLPCGSECLVRVRIGGEDSAWQNFGNVPFPTHELPPTAKGGWDLQVYLFTNSGDAAQSSTLFLPATGNSAWCEFRCNAGNGSVPFRARVVVAHGNRVLQSAWLEAPVRGESGEVLGSLARGLEMVVRPRFSGLDERSAFGAFIIVNDSLTQGPGVAIASGPSAALRTPPDLNRTIAFIDGELTKISNRPEQYEGGLQSKAVIGLLRNLAQYGRLMYEAIIEDQQVDRALIDAKRVQVVAAESGARLPIEFFYDQLAPDPEVPLCPGAARCLRGEMAAGPAPCNDACPAAVESNELICPRGFWGLRKVIEWHRHSGDKNQDGDFRLQSEPDAQRRSIPAFQSVLFAHSDRVDEYDAQASSNVLDALKAASPLTHTADDWKDWRCSVSSHSPLLMVVLPHNEESSNALPELSIGSGTQRTHRLLLSSITDKVVVGPNTRPGAIVMLLGCETGAPKTSYLGYVPMFRRHGASIILSTGAVVLGRQISPICVRLIKGLQAAVEKGPAPLGEVMLRLRRELLADGFPIVLALNASGDADWLIE